MPDGRSGRSLLALTGLLAIACAGPPRAPKYCDAKEEVVDAYLGRVVGRASNAMSPTALARTEQVTVTFEIEPSGIPTRISVLSASTPVAAEAARDAVTSGAPYGAPPFSQKACLIGGHIAASFYASGRCDERLSDAYVDGVSAEVMAAMNRVGILVDPAETVILRVDIAHDGSVETVTVRSDDARHSGDEIAAITRELSPFDVPHELILDCVADSPLFLWYGSANRAPL